MSSKPDSAICRRVMNAQNALLSTRQPSARSGAEQALQQACLHAGSQRACRWRERVRECVHARLRAPVLPSQQGAKLPFVPTCQKPLGLRGVQESLVTAPQGASRTTTSWMPCR